MGDPAVIRIFDTTLRDGEQSPGATMTTEEKLQVAEQLVRLNVDIIEAGFPAASPGDLEAVTPVTLKRSRRSPAGTGAPLSPALRAPIRAISMLPGMACEELSNRSSTSFLQPLIFTLSIS